MVDFCHRTDERGFSVLGIDDLIAGMMAENEVLLDLLVEREFITHEEFAQRKAAALQRMEQRTQAAKERVMGEDRA